MPISRAGNFSKQRGFTLIELALVVLLISLMTALAVPLLQGNRGQLEGAARHLAGTVKYLFNEAALTGQEHRLVIDLEQDSYRGQIVQADRQVVELSGLGGIRQLGSNIEFEQLLVTGRGSYTRGEVSLRFDPSGWVDEAWFYLRGSGDQVVTLVINPLTGVSEVFPGRQEYADELPAAGS